MNIKRLVVGTVLGTVVLYLLGTLIWQMLFADFFEANSGSAMGVDRETPILWAMVLGHAFYGLLVTLGLEVSGKKGIAGGLLVGAIVGAGIWGTADFILLGITNLNTVTGAVADVVLEGVRGAIAGVVVALVLDMVGD